MRVTENLALFPLQTVLFPGGRLSLKVFEARYLDLMTTCLRENKPFGVVALREGSEVRRSGDTVLFERIGTTAELVDVDSPKPGLLAVRCRGGSRFRIESRRQHPDGLWTAEVEPLPDDETLAPDQALHDSVRALANAIASLKAQGTEPFESPYRFEWAGWVANRWCEILPIPMAAKQRLMELPDPQARLKLVDDYLRGQGVVG